ncbi:hypothetical protein [Thalassospira lucentensis]|uniref:hypothetical protein n=1 Tax=Thalassospira lucentensis TaxID=168935 RepID=UPI00142E8C13|nr:hypothetical protein [Thalassospira lucentensis]NIZ02195.1 hypothetical protein [Thalassospira lucentensis]
MAIAPARNVGRECDARMSLDADIAMFFQVYGRLIARKLCGLAAQGQGPEKKNRVAKHATRQGSTRSIVIFWTYSILRMMVFL